MYQIESKTDFQAGVTLSVRIAEEDVDWKALYTMAECTPDFLLPFHYKKMDGRVELTYQVGSKSKLSYLSAERSPNEYADLWSRILQPLLDCRDWFMTAYSFVLDVDYLYCDKNTKEIRFLYIPSIRPYSDPSGLKSMVTEIVRQNRVTDVSLENKVMWALQDFSPSEFLQTVKSSVVPKTEIKREIHKEQVVKPENPVPQQSGVPFVEPKIEEESPKRSFFGKKEPKAAEPPVLSGEVAPNNLEDIVIRFPNEGEHPEGKDEKKGFFAFGKGKKKEKEKQEKEEKGGFFGRKKEKSKEIVGGAAVENRQPLMPSLFNENIEGIDRRYDVTELDIDESDGGAKLRYVGHEDHPRVICVETDASNVFTIGRFDVSVGVRRSAFEFDKKTKAVSRRHAAIERKEDGYYLVDLSSSGGTYVDGCKIPPNTPVKLSRGNRISFGHAGADYVWEE